MRASVSIIIPAYNAEGYIRECLDSVLAQSFKDYELIVVDDGSTDSTNDILKEYACSDSRMKVLQQKNSGQSVARNNGLRHSTGRFVVFVDSDDYMASPDALAKMCHVIDESEADFVQCGFSFVKNATESRYNVTGRRPLYGRSILIDMLKVNNLYTSPWAKIYSRDFLVKNKLSFPEGIVNEDTAFSIMIAAIAQKAAFLSDCVYCSIEREGSTSRASFKRMFETMNIALQSTRQFLIQHNVYDNEIQRLYEARYVRSMLYNILQSGQRLSFGLFSEDYVFCMENTDYKLYMRSIGVLPLKHRLMARLSKSPLAVFSAIRILNFFSVRMH